MLKFHEIVFGLDTSLAAGKRIDIGRFSVPGGTEWTVWMQLMAGQPHVTIGCIGPYHIAEWQRMEANIRSKIPQSVLDYATVIDNARRDLAFWAMRNGFRSHVLPRYEDEYNDQAKTAVPTPTVHMPVPAPTKPTGKVTIVGLPTEATPPLVFWKTLAMHKPFLAHVKGFTTKLFARTQLGLVDLDSEAGIGNSVWTGDFNIEFKGYVDITITVDAGTKDNK